MKIGQLYTLEKQYGIAAYAMYDTYSFSRKRKTDWISSNKFQEPFMLIAQHGEFDNYWIKILIEDKIGWIHVDSSQLKLFNG